MSQLTVSHDNYENCIILVSFYMVSLLINSEAENHTKT